MIWQFGPFELDEPRRQLRLRSREVVVEPLVFDLLVETLPLEPRRLVRPAGRVPCGIGMRPRTRELTA